MRRASRTAPDTGSSGSDWMSCMPRRSSSLRTSPPRSALPRSTPPARTTGPLSRRRSATTAARLPSVPAAPVTTNSASGSPAAARSMTTRARGPADRAAGPPRTQRHRRGQVADPACSGVAPRAQRATAAGAGDGARGQVGLDPVGHSDADHDTTGSRRGARCTSVVYQPPQRQGSTGVARRPARPNRRCRQLSLAHGTRSCQR